MALPATDTFTAADGTNLTTYSANWTYVVGSALQINTNALYGAATGDKIALWNADAFSADQYSTATFVALVTGYVGCAVRCSTASSGSAYLVNSNSGNGTYLDKRVSGTTTGIGNAGSATEGNVIRTEANGTTIRVLLNDGEVISVTDSALSSGSAGVDGSSNSTSARLDTWEGGNIGAAAATSLVIKTSGSKYQHLLVR